MYSYIHIYMHMYRPQSYVPQSYVQVIRANSNNLIILGTRVWSQDVMSHPRVQQLHPSAAQDVDGAAEDPVEGENLAYTIHFYANTHKQAQLPIEGQVWVISLLLANLPLSAHLYMSASMCLLARRVSPHIVARFFRILIAKLELPGAARQSDEGIGGTCAWTGSSATEP